MPGLGFFINLNEIILSTELLINSTQNGCRIALLKDKNLVEYHEEPEGDQISVGDMYLGTVKKVVPGLNAAFIEIGHEKDAFLHYLDLGPQFNSLNKFVTQALKRKNVSHRFVNFKMESDIDKHGKINQVLRKGQQILVQVVKEPISTKGPRLSSELSIAGRYLILVPFGSGISISKKITKSDERKRLQRLISSIKPENLGIIIRTIAEGKDVAQLDNDLRQLVFKWEQGVERLKKGKPKMKIIGEVSLTSALLRDVLNESFDNIYADEKETFEELRDYIKIIAPDKEKLVKHYYAKIKLFEKYGIEKQIKSAFGQSVTLKGGGYLIIEHTEAMHVVDVNSGNKSNREEDQEKTALSVNIEAAKEIARQLRLRDMGGIIVVDFIDMRRVENKRLLSKTLKEEMQSDRSKFTILPLSKFGLMQITRQRVRPERNITTKEVCPVCKGSGKVGATVLLPDEIETSLNYLITKQNIKNIKIILNPLIYDYFTKGLISKRVKWYFKYKKWVKLQRDSSISMLDYKFLDESEQEIIMDE